MLCLKSNQDHLPKLTEYVYRLVTDQPAKRISLVSSDLIIITVCQFQIQNSLLSYLVNNVANDSLLKVNSVALSKIVAALA